MEQHTTVGLRSCLCQGSLRGASVPEVATSMVSGTQQGEKDNESIRRTSEGVVQPGYQQQLPSSWRVRPAAECSNSGALRRGSGQGETPCSGRCSKDACKENSISTPAKGTRKSYPGRGLWSYMALLEQERTKVMKTSVAVVNEPQHLYASEKVQ